MTRKNVSLLGVLFMLTAAVFVITGCPQTNKPPTPAPTPAPAPAPTPTPTPTPTPEPTIEGVPWECIYTTKSGWEGAIVTLNGTTATFKFPGKDAFNVACVIDKANKIIKLVFSFTTDEYNYAVKENGTILELSANGTLWHKLKKM